MVIGALCTPTTITKSLFGSGLSSPLRGSYNNSVDNPAAVRIAGLRWMHFTFFLGIVTTRLLAMVVHRTNALGPLVVLALLATMTLVGIVSASLPGRALRVASKLLREEQESIFSCQHVPNQKAVSRPGTCPPPWLISQACLFCS